jgi:hypothetical protein
LILVTLAHNDRFILGCIIALAEEGGLSAALQVNCTCPEVYRNTGGMSKLEGPKELVYGVYPAQLRMLC